MALDVRRLRVLRELARHGTIAATARALHLTPPAVSQQLAALEREADARLLHREGRKVILTEAAHTLVAHTETILTQLEAAAADIAAMEGRYGGSLRIGAFPSAASTFVAAGLAQLASPLSIRIYLNELEPERSLVLLKGGDLDLAIAHEYELVPRRADPAIRRVELRTEALHVALPPDHRLVAAPGVDLGELADERWIAPPDGLTCLDQLRRLCATAGFDPILGSSAYTHPSIFALVAGGLGVALVPELARPHNLAGAIIKPLRHPAAHRHIFVAARNGSIHRPSIASALTALQAAAACGPAGGPGTAADPATPPATGS